MQFRAQFGLFQVENHVQTAYESHDSNMDFVHLTTDWHNKFYRRAAFSPCNEFFMNTYMTYKLLQYNVHYYSLLNFCTRKVLNTLLFGIFLLTTIIFCRNCFVM